jgi:predicted RNA binding protein YcfA (HicA-like mRNA interferase family)
MGSQMPILSGREVVRSFEKFGWIISRQSASHIILTKAGAIASLSVPDHREVARGTLRSLIRAADLTVEEFKSAVGK